MSRYNVYGVGNALVDLEFEIPEARLAELSVDKGLMTLIEEDRHHALLAELDGVAARPCGGGSAANTLTAVAQLGGKAWYSCKVADDDTGRFFLQDLTANGVETNLSGGALEAGLTGKCIILITPDAERSMSTFLGITRELSVAALDEEALKASDFLYLEGYPVTETHSRAALVRAREIAVAAGVPVSMTLSDVNMVRYFRDGLLEIAGDALDMLFANQDEAMLMTGATDIDACVTGMKALSRRFAITRGGEPAVLWDGETVIEVAPDIVTPVDSNGAGDVYAGAFLHGLTHGLPFARCGELANEAAKTLILRFGARLSAEEMRGVAARVGI